MFWKSLLRQALLNNYLSKDIDNYGLLRLTKSGSGFIDSPYSLKFVMNRELGSMDDDFDDTDQQAAGALDAELFKMLKDLCKKMGVERNLPAYVIFSDPSLEDLLSSWPFPRLQ